MMNSEGIKVNTRENLAVEMRVVETERNIIKNIPGEVADLCSEALAPPLLCTRELTVVKGKKISMRKATTTEKEVIGSGR